MSKLRIVHNFSMVMVLITMTMSIAVGVSGFKGFGQSVSNAEAHEIHTKNVKKSTMKMGEVVARAYAQEMQRIEQEKIHQSAIERAKQGLHAHSDLGDQLELTGEDMNLIIDEWTSHIDDSVLRGHGDAFIIASQRTGLNPIYLLAHAITESGSGTSYLARTRSNFYGINAVDSNPDLAYHMGDTVDDGIISGAEWIKSNFYDNGYTTLASMKEAGYASSDRWVGMIVDIANTTVRYL